MARWKIINSLTVEDLGIEEVSEDNEGYIVVDLVKLQEKLPEQSWDPKSPESERKREL